ncbi:DUF4266 domain-containing protein [Chitinimonas sp.]|uniref:DUF4266 domain-containing protein n=1 Tax=Chitinimonas sp. TaxID=1934313 RepID=UPI0035B4E15A
MGLGLLLSLAGCAAPAPWQRGALAKPVMNPANTLHTAMREHSYQSREAASGSMGAGAAGCGCY